jgi:hypothetical protein
MGIQRMQLASNKKSASVKHAKREIDELLRENKDEKARIKVEHVIREDFMIESYGLLELFCELAHERIRYISSQRVRRRTEYVSKSSVVLCDYKSLTSFDDSGCLLDKVLKTFNSFHPHCLIRNARRIL